MCIWWVHHSYNFVQLSYNLQYKRQQKKLTCYATLIGYTHFLYQLCQSMILCFNFLNHCLPTVTKIFIEGLIHTILVVSVKVTKLQKKVKHFEKNSLIITRHLYALIRAKIKDINHIWYHCLKELLYEHFLIHPQHSIFVTLQETFW